MYRLAHYILVGILASVVTYTRAYEVDIHYSTTYALAVGIGWTPEDARVIAGAAEGVDRNKTTVAALEADFVVLSDLSNRVSVQRGIMHQAQKNFVFHCFSDKLDKHGTVDPSVGVAITKLLSRVVKPPLNSNEKTEGDRLRLRMLVAIGVALHCIQDSRSHNGYGGGCPKRKQPPRYSGSCYGHTIDSFRDKYRRIFGTRTNPDHPAVRPYSDLWNTITATSNFLSQQLQILAPRYPPGQVPSKHRKLGADNLIKALYEPASQKLSDKVRQECNREVVGAWLHDTLRTQGRSSLLPATNAVLDKACAKTWPPSVGKMRVVIPNPDYPRLTDAADIRQWKGSKYVPVDDTDAYDLQIAEVQHQGKACTNLTCEYFFSVRVSNERQVRSLPGLLLIAVIPSDSDRAPFGAKVPLSLIDARSDKRVSITVDGPREDSYFVYTDIEPLRNTSNDWKDANAENDSAVCYVKGGGRPEDPDDPDLPRCNAG